MEQQEEQSDPHTDNKSCRWQKIMTINIQDPIMYKNQLTNTCNTSHTSASLQSLQLQNKHPLNIASNNIHLPQWSNPSQPQGSIISKYTKALPRRFVPGCFFTPIDDSPPINRPCGLCLHTAGCFFIPNCPSRLSLHAALSSRDRRIGGGSEGGGSKGGRTLTFLPAQIVPCAICLLSCVLVFDF